MNGENDLYSNKKLDQINEKLNRIFNINVNHIIQNNDDKVAGIKFTLPQGNENSNDIIFELLDFYIIPAFILNNTNTTSIINIKINNKASNRIITIKKYIKDNNIYIDSKQAEQQKEKAGQWQKVKNLVQNLIDGIEEIEFIEINKDKFNFDFNSSTSTEVKITFASSEINIKYIEEVLKCVSNFKKLTENETVKSLIKVNHHQLTTESEGKLNIYPFFAKKVTKCPSTEDVSEKITITTQEIVLCLTSNQNKAELVSSIFGGGQDKFEIDYGQEKHPFFSYNLNNTFSSSLLRFFNDQSYNGEVQISNLQKIEKQLSEKINIEGSQKKEEESENSDEVEIKIENVCLPLKNLIQERKICFYFDVKVGNGSDQIGNESKYIYETVICKITSLISFFDLCLNKDKFSISVEVDGKEIFSVKRPLANNIMAKVNSLYNMKYYTEELVPSIDKQLKDYASSLIKDYTNIKPQHVQVLDLFYTKKVSFRLEVECQKIKLNNLNNIESLVGGISILNAQSKAFSDTINNPLVRCYLSNFLYKNDNQVSCTYVITYPKNFKIESLFDKFQESFKSISNSFEKTQGDGHSLYSMTIDTDELLNNPKNEPKEVQNIEIVTEVTEELKITEEGTDAKPQSKIEYNVDREKECFCKIGDANDYDALEQNLKEASKFVHERLVYVCEQLLKKIETMQLGGEQSPSKQFLTMDESTAEQYRTTLNENIKNCSNFINKKDSEYKKLNLNETQKSNIDKLFDKLKSAVCDYEKIGNLSRFVGENGTRLPEVLEKNIEKLEQLIEEITTDELVKEVTQDFNTTSQVDTATGEISLSHEDTELGDTKDINSIKDNNLPQPSTEEQTDCIDEDKEVENLDINVEENLQQANDNEEQKKNISNKDVFELFQKLNSKLDEWGHFSANLQSSDKNKSIPDLFDRLKDKINRNIKLKKTNEELAKQYEQMLSLVNDIFYNAKILYYYTISNSFEELEKEIHNTVGPSLYYLEKELKTKEKESNEIPVQKINTAEVSSNFIEYVDQKIASAAGFILGTLHSVKDKIVGPKNEMPYEVHKSSNNNSYGYDYRPKNSNTRKSCYNSSNDNNYSSTDSPCNQSLPSPKLSNPKKCKRTLKTMFSEKENYVFLISAIIGVGAILGYFVPGGLRDLVPPEKQTYIDVTIAVGASILIILCFAALIYSAYATIKISNLSLESQPVQQNDTIHR